ncbi:MAG: hypothetical protein LBG78_01470, partial [Azoarcus sp.]|nr:hypothetical protein [Azoarcus sp.]
MSTPEPGSAAAKAAEAARAKAAKKLTQHVPTPADKATQAVRKKIDGMTHLGRLADATPGAITYPELNEMLDAFASAFTQKNRILTFQIG